MAAREEGKGRNRGGGLVEEAAGTPEFYREEKRVAPSRRVEAMPKREKNGFGCVVGRLGQNQARGRALGRARDPNGKGP
jgi:hypothetical protein